MTPFLSWLKKNAVTASMLLFLGLSYGIFIASAPSTTPTDGESMAVSTGLMSEAELRGREARFKKSIEEHPRFYSAVMGIFLLAITAALLLDLALAARFLQGKPLFAEGALHLAVPWGAGTVFRLFLLLLCVDAGLAWLVKAYCAYAAVDPKAHANLIIMANSVARDVIVAAFLIGLVKIRYHTRLAEIGFTLQGFWRQVLTGVVAYLAATPILVALLVILSITAKFFHYQPPPQAVVEIYLKEQMRSMLLLFTLFVAVLGPVMEELFFRGFAYKAIRSQWGVWQAALITALFFSLLHANLVALVPIFFLGLFLAWLYEKSGSLVPGMVAHMLHNIIMVGLTLSFKALSQ